MKYRFYFLFFLPKIFHLINVCIATSGIDTTFTFPDIYCYQTEYGEELYAMVYKPFDFDPKKKYPTILNVYGGPEVQLVYNSFRVRRFTPFNLLMKMYLKFAYICVLQGVGQLWLYLLASQGYCVVSVDSRGSHHRGLQFESHIRRRMVSELRNPSFWLCFSLMKFPHNDM